MARPWWLPLLLAPVLAACSAASAGPSIGSSAAGSPTGTATTGTMTLTSPAVEDGRLLAAFRCEPRIGGAEASIPLAWDWVPAGTASLAVAMTHHPDPSDPSNVSAYLLLWGIPPAATGIPAGAADEGPWHLGANKDGVEVSYTSPCSRGSGTHAYTITLYALAATPAALPDESSLAVTYPVLAAAIRSVPVLATAVLTFTDTTP